MSDPIVSGKGTKKSKDIGVFGTRSGAGKGVFIGSTFGDGWLKGIEDRLTTRLDKCSKCGIERLGGKCPEPCGYESMFGGW